MLKQLLASCAVLLSLGSSLHPQTDSRKDVRTDGSVVSPDEEFDSSVGSPAYTSTHPKVLIDHAHFNLRYPVGRSLNETFSRLITADGYEVRHNTARFSATALE